MTSEKEIRLACVIITFHPDNKVLDNIQSFRFLDRIFVMDNTETPIAGFREKLDTIPNTVFIHDGENAGIGKRLNQACRMAKEEGYEWLLTMDQDSYFETGMLDNYKRCIVNFPAMERVSMFGVNFGPRSAGGDACNARSNAILITSGSMVNLSLFEKTGGFNEWMFIDLVDTEYCLKAMRLRYECVQFNNIILNHQLGTKVEARSLKDLRSSGRTIHSPGRIFYMVRNYFYIRDVFEHEFPEEIRQFRRDLLNRIKNNLLYGRSRLKTAGKIIAGYRDYLKSKGGGA